MPWNLLLLPLLGGYYYCTRCYTVKYKYRRADGNRLLLAAALHGVVAMISSSIVLTLLYIPLVSCCPSLNEARHLLAPFPHFGKAMGAFIGAVAFTHIRNAFCDERKQKIKIVDEEGDLLEQFFHDAFSRSMPLLLSLKSGKVYVCVVTDGIATDRKYIKVIPFWSGYRTKDTQKIEFTTDYVAVFQHMVNSGEERGLDDFSLTIPTDQIATATFFDKALYDAHFAERRQDERSKGASAA